MKDTKDEAPGGELASLRRLWLRQRLDKEKRRLEEYRKTLAGSNPNGDFAKQCVAPLVALQREIVRLVERAQESKP